jgi:competence protein ComEC
MSLTEAALERGGGPMRRRQYGQSAGSRATGASDAAAAAGWRVRIEEALDAERGRWFLWLPVFFGCGIALYLALLSEPPAILAIAGVVLAAALRVFLRGTSLRLIASSSILMMALGFAAAKFQVVLGDGPVLQREMRYVTVSGWIERIERQEKRTRLTLRVIAVERLTPDQTPHRVRVSYNGDRGNWLAGDAIELRATLMPPPEPVLPGGYDFARHYWFKGLGASGYAMGKVTPLAKPPPAPSDLRARAALGNIRQAIAARVDRVLEGDRAGVANALIVGDRGALSEPTTQALRDAGLAHVIAISGFHMALTAGTLFWLIRALLGLFPALALRYPIKIWAALGALVIASVYLGLSGAAVSAIRAYIMVAIVFGAIILNRPAISLRNLAIAAFVILALMPHSLVDAGFQMSFAATAALIAFYESRPSLARFDGWPRLVTIPLIFIIDIASTTLLAGLAVDPFAAYHFHRIAIYSMLGNILAIPVIGFVVMPMVLLTLLAMPFGLEEWPLLVMDQGIAWMLGVAAFTSSLPGAAPAIPAFPEGALPLVIFGALWLMIWRGRWRWLGLLAIGGGLTLTPFGERGDIWIDRDGKLVAVRDQDGNIATTKSRKASFSLERWMEADGDGRPVKEARGSKAFQCDDTGCIVLVKGRLVTHVHHPAALKDDCQRAAVLIADFTLPDRCEQPEIIVDRLDLKESGAHMLTIGPAGVTVRTVAEERGIRPWVTVYRRRETIPETAQ